MSSPFDDFFNQARAKASYLTVDPLLTLDKRLNKDSLARALHKASGSTEPFDASKPTAQEILQAIRNRKKEDD